MIPKYLLEQVRDLPWEVEDFYRQWRLYEGPFQFLYALVNEEKLVKGVLWLSVMPMSRVLYVNLVSLDREYQSQGYMQSLIIPFIRKVRATMDLKKIVWHASGSHVKAFTRYGFKPSVYTMMEGT